jgi:hypothetical protein
MADALSECERIENRCEGHSKHGCAVVLSSCAEPRDLVTSSRQPTSQFPSPLEGSKARGGNKVLRTETRPTGAHLRDRHGSERLRDDGVRLRQRSCSRGRQRRVATDSKAAELGNGSG